MCTHNYTDSLCSLRVIPRMDGVGITFECNGQCTLTSSFSNNQCVDHINALGIQCNQTECSPRDYDLSACITGETEISIPPTNHTTICRCSIDRDAVTNDIAVEPSQASTSTTVYRTEIANRTEAQNVSCTTKPLSSTEAQCHIVIGVLVGLLVVLLVMAVIPWICMCWRFKSKGKRDIQQAIAR